MRQTVGKRRPVIEHTRGRHRGEQCPEGVVTGPVVEDLGSSAGGQMPRRPADALSGAASSPQAPAPFGTACPAAIQARGRRRSDARTPRYPLATPCAARST